MIIVLIRMMCLAAASMGMLSLVQSNVFAAVNWPRETLELLDFESAKYWEDAVLAKSPVKSGSQSAKWEFAKTAGLATTNMPRDISLFGVLSFWVHSAKANRAEFMIVLGSRAAPGVNSYYSERVLVDWEGWKQVKLPLADFDQARSPAGFNKIDSLRFTCRGWGMTPIEETVLHLDKIEFSGPPAPPRLAKVAKVYLPQPPRDAFQKSLRRERPRLMVTPEDVARLKEQVKNDPKISAWYQNTKAQAQKILKEKPSIYEKPDGRRLLSTSRRVLDRIYNLGFVYLMEGDESCLRRAYKELEAAGKFPDWNPSHYLDTAEMMHAFGIGYDWLYPGLTPAERQTIREALYKHGLRLSYNAYRNIRSEGSQSWKTVENNWNFVCNGGSSIAAMALLDEQLADPVKLPEVCTEILHSAFRDIQIPISHFEPDGAWWEGVSYWGYSLRYFAPYLQCLETAFGTDFGFVNALNGTGFSRTGDFPIYLCSPLGSYFNFADSGSGRGEFSHPAFFFLASKFNNPLYQWFEDSKTKKSVHDILHYRPMASARDIASFTLDRHFKETEVATLRNSWTDPNAAFAGFKAGRNGIAHSHDDLGSFIYYALGEPWLVDLGTEHQTYLSHQHSYKRWEFYRIRAEGHNTLVINPNGAQDQAAKGEAKIARFEAQPHEAILISDLSGAYPQVKQVRRGLRFFDCRHSLLVQDEIEAATNAVAWWFVHTPGKITVNSDKRTASIALNGKTLNAVLLSPANAEFQAMKAEPLPGSPNPARQESNKGYAKLGIKGQDSKLTISVAFMPCYDFDSRPAPRPPVIPLDKWTIQPAPPLLSALTMDGKAIPDFAPGVFSYWLKAGAGGVGNLAATPQSSTATLKIRKPTQLPGVAEISVADPEIPGKMAVYRLYLQK